MTKLPTIHARSYLVRSLLVMGWLFVPFPPCSQSATPPPFAQPTPQGQQVGAQLQLPTGLRPIQRDEPVVSERAEFEFPPSSNDQNQIDGGLIEALDINSFIQDPDLNAIVQDPEVMPAALDPEGDIAQNDETDVIQQHFPDGKLQIRRHVAQDEKGNFYNHGLWEAFDRKGEVVARGNYDRGLMDGQWMRKHDSGTDGLFKTRPFNLFQGPYYSVAHFKLGKMNGVWKIFDPYRRSISEVPYREGIRHGTATWWFPNAAKMRTVHFTDGLIDGAIAEWDDKDQPTAREEYDQGRKIVRTTAFYRPGQKESEDYFLDAKLVPQGEDSWWDAKPSDYLPEGSRIQNGSSMAWYSNSQPKKKGQFKDGQQIGQFVWWHSNGNIKTRGMYQDGKKTRQWTWWFDNGMKQFEGNYEDDSPVGVWRAWNEDGQIQKEEDFSHKSDSNSILNPNSDAIDDTPVSDEPKPDQPESVDSQPDGDESDFILDPIPNELPPPPNTTDSDPASDNPITKEGRDNLPGDSNKDGSKKIDTREAITPLVLDGPTESTTPKTSPKGD